MWRWIWPVTTKLHRLQHPCVVEAVHRYNCLFKNRLYLDWEFYPVIHCLLTHLHQCIIFLHTLASPSTWNVNSPHHCPVYSLCLSQARGKTQQCSVLAAAPLWPHVNNQTERQTIVESHCTRQMFPPANGRTRRCTNSQVVVVTGASNAISE